MRNLSPLLRPQSVAVIGASSNLKSPSGKPVRFLRDSGLDIKVYPVNPSREEIGDYKAYPDPESLPTAPDVAIIVTPGPAVEAAVAALATRGTKAAIIITSGFAEGARAEGAEAQARIGQIARDNGMVILGPNTLGIHDYARGLPLSFVWYGAKPVNDSGAVAVVSQSGSGMTSLCDRLIDVGLPVGLGVATGNEVDLTVVDLLEYLVDDEATKVIVTVVEEIREGKRFLEVCRKLQEKGKPLILLKVGRTESGAAMVKSHTGALAGAYPVLHALLQQHGVIEVTDLDQIPAMAAVALLQRTMETDGISLVTNSGGAAALAADRADELGVPLPPLSTETHVRVKENLPEFAQDQDVSNPIDITAQNIKRPFAIVDIAKALVDDTSVGGVIVAIASGGGPDGVVWADQLIELVHTSPKPIVTVVLTGQESNTLRTKLRAAGVPVLSSPGAAVETLYRLRRANTSRVVDASQQELAEATALPDTLTEYSALKWLEHYGVPVVTQQVATTSEEAVAAARAIGFPVVVKIHSADIPHKTEVGGVALNLANDEEVAAATQQILISAAQAEPDATIEGVTVSPMVQAELELISGIHLDPTFGPVILLGLGGIWAEVLGDVTMRSLPISETEAESMINDLKGKALLRGARGRTPVNVTSVQKLLNSLAHIAADHGDALGGIDLNPVAVTSNGELVVLDSAIFTQ